MEDESLQCAACRRSAPAPAVGWQAFIAGGYDGEPLELGVFCPECFEREVPDAQAA